jgi:hypothetical protein
MTVCGQCGAPISSPFCASCGATTSTVDAAPASSQPVTISVMAPALADVAQAGPGVLRQEPELFYGRTPFQIALLLFATLGVYETYWLIRTRRLADYRLHQEVRPYWHYFGLIVPFLNIYLVFSAASRAQRRVEASLGSATVSFPLFLFVALVLDWLWRLPGSYWIVSFLSGIPIIVMHADWARAERADDPARTWTNFMWAEWLFVILGFLLVALAVAGSLVDVSRAEQLTVVAVVIIIIGTLFATYRMGKNVAPVKTG